MELFIIRHAQSYNNALPDERDRVVDPPLTEVGLRQAELIATHLRDGTDFETSPCETEIVNGTGGCAYGITRLFCSPMLRALQTGTIIGKALDLKPEVWVDIHEQGGMWLDHGQPTGIIGYPGMTRAEIAEQFPGVFLPPGITEAGWWTYRGQEEKLPFTERAGRTADALRAWPEPAERVALVTHGGFANGLLRSLLRVTPDVRLFLHHDNTGITRVRIRPDGSVSLRYLNRVGHLPPGLVT